MSENLLNLDLAEVELRVLAQVVADPKAAVKSWWPHSPPERVIAEQGIKDFMERHYDHE